ncbi:hypothetical protein [Flavobacterium sp. N2820]|uniref:hypothetical protein n=1 Tax=Flavobacterium sp. N2820 TaxID=2986834 RepID=UPI00222581EF|nr:hypothetical protein [Flavobacterium sp. N2820]
MKNIISKGCLFFVLTILLISCGSTKSAVVQNNTATEKTITETVHDTIFKIEADSSTYQALLDCQNGKVVVKEVINAEPGRTLKSPKVRIDNNKLRVDCEARAQELFAQWKSTHETEKIFVSKEIPVITNKLTWWQQTKIRLFWILLIYVSVSLIWKGIKPKFL